MKSACPGVTTAGFFRGFQLADDAFDILVAILFNADFTMQRDRPSGWAAAFAEPAGWIAASALV